MKRMRRAKGGAPLKLTAGIAGLSGMPGRSIPRL